MHSIAFCNSIDVGALRFASMVHLAAYTLPTVGRHCETTVGLSPRRARYHHPRGPAQGLTHL